MDTDENSDLPNVMPESDTDPLSRSRTYWAWFTVAMYLLISVDLLTTAGAVTEFGLGVESNPVMVWLIHQGPVFLTVAHLLVVVFAAYAFSGVLSAVEQAPKRFQPVFRRGVEVWVALLIALGLFIAFNNLFAIITGNYLL